MGKGHLGALRTPSFRLLMAVGPGCQLAALASLAVLSRTLPSRAIEVPARGVRQP
jgi:hypothetical protein